MMDPSRLPELVVERLFSFLPVEDLFKSSLVNLTWRDAINKNIIWKRHCTLPISYENVQCKVVPIFQTPPRDCERLSPLCRYRIHYMRQIHVLNNFIHNRSVEYNIFTDNKFVFLDKYLIVNNQWDKVFEVSLDQSLSHVVKVPYLLKDMNVKTFQIVDDVLVIVQCNMLQVYHIDDGIVSLKLCRLFDKEEKFSEMIPPDDSVSSWYVSTIKADPKKFTSHNAVAGNCFIGIVESPDLNQSILHVWDLKSGNKLKEDKFPPLEIKINKIICGANSQFLYIAFYMSDGQCKIVCYSFKTLQYTQFYVESKESIDSMLCAEKVIVLTYCQDDNIWGRKGRIMCLDAVTGHKKLEKTCNCLIYQGRFDVHENLLVYPNGHTMTVVDLGSGEEVSCLDMNIIPYRVHLLDNNKLLVGLYDECEDPIVEVWDIFKKRIHYWWDKKYIVPYERSLARVSYEYRSSKTLICHYW